MFIWNRWSRREAPGEFTTDRILTRAFEADLDGLFFSFIIANLAGRMLVQACGSEAQAAALVDNCINELVRDRARAASLHLDLGLVLGFGVPSGFGLGLGLSFDPRRVFAAGLPLGLLRRDALRGQVGPHEELVQPRRPVILGRRGLILRAGLRSRPRIQLGRG
jgi:hypothetical protein